MTKVRWIALVPVTALAWWLVLIVGMFVYGVVEQSLCPPDDWISETCANESVQTTLDYIVLAVSGLSAVGVVLSAVLIAPTNKRAVAWVAWVVVSGVAVAATLPTDDWIHGLVATACGCATIVLVSRTRLIYE